MEKDNLPVVGILCDLEQVGPHPFHMTGNKYIQAIIDAAGCIPILIPAMAEQTRFEDLLTSIDGILLPGGYSMVDPLNYQETEAIEGTKLDIARDKTSFGLIKQAITNGVPIFGICRGFQEMNVAFGGTLHQQLHEQKIFQEHRENKSLSLDEQYADCHQVKLMPDGQLSKIMETETVKVNSLHTQGVDKLADNLTIEAMSEDGLCEAFSVTNAKVFSMAVQWHPEWKVAKNNKNRKLFAAFGTACKARQTARNNNG
ncbi:gamma-glutamyl-gamma-aminobutyrate hydrolase family protein [Thalassotalea castellviae]|uniref:Gamma-glutamyl-gamma-aminobutyrate hydrolase family protein n=1 Tax=Thalassotalea castellviae TaxID=3075612 RepID=A0ABU3A159_9GAMM|nr:gamma-glutamyl-gamma-aminobutyrate hydrolase family protein [Thalassotalea sp. W431]MDT0603910.1 gamma-glutamyl-gamma-aminobutyrate hydrolase family protein [Thalassotalea sp. W431]